MSSGPVRLRTALVLGGTSDIARAILDELVPLGLERAVLAVRDPGAVVHADHGASRGGPGHVGLGDGALHVVRWDATEVASHAALLDAAAEHLGRIDVVLCAVGMLGHHAGRSMGPVEVDEMVRSNFAGPAGALAESGSRLARQGSGTIVVLSSVAGVRPRRSNYVYGSTKSGLDAFARGMRDALQGTGVEVLVVRPGFVVSRMTEGLQPAPFASTPEAVAAAVVARLRSGRGGVVWVPPLLGPLFAVLANLPGALWRRIAGDR